ncbi:MAG: preprotein translocase subunit SecE [Oscillospiraceae bacterium]|jgi:preprotein translocase subunit SecE|nr:preprotein translocase subunit SecE [Oscillospiraceae bacterium]
MSEENNKNDDALENETGTVNSTDAAAEAKKKLKAAEKAAVAKQAKPKKPKGEGSAKVKKFWKDFRGEIKKITWPDFRTVLKSTGIVIATVCVIGAMIWILDFGLTQGIRGLKYLATQTTTTTTTAATTAATTEAAAEEATTLADEAVTTLAADAEGTSVS